MITCSGGPLCLDTDDAQAWIMGSVAPSSLCVIIHGMTSCSTGLFSHAIFRFFRVLLHSPHYYVSLSLPFAF